MLYDQMSKLAVYKAPAEEEAAAAEAAKPAAAAPAAKPAPAKA
jgi:hypothetical protein